MIRVIQTKVTEMPLCPIHKRALTFFYNGKDFFDFKCPKKGCSFVFSVKTIEEENEVVGD